MRSDFMSRRTGLSDGSSWRQLVRSHADQDEAEVIRVRGQNGHERDIEHIERLLTQARAIADESRWLRGAWSGGNRDRAYMSIHLAEAKLDELLSGAELEAHAIDLLVKAQKVLPKGDERVKRVEVMLAHQDGDDGDGPPPLDPVAVAHLARAVYDTADERYAQSRSFRNRLVRLSIITLGVWVLFAAAFATGVIQIQISGEGEPPTYLETTWIISIFGLVGALISSVPSLARVTGTWNPFSLPFYQMVLKLVLGPVFAIVGVLMLQAGVVPDIDGQMPLNDLLVWALVFGASQHVVTRFVDSRVAGLVSSEPTERTGPGQGGSQDA